VPCLDSPWDKSTWEFEFVVTKRLEEKDQERARKQNLDTLDDELPEDEYPTVVVCSGDLVEQVRLIPIFLSVSFILMSGGAPLQFEQNNIFV
jgi:hypothetical protein